MTLEAVYLNSNYNFWISVFVLTKTPHPIIDTLNAEITKALVNPTVWQKLEKIGGEPETMSVDAFNNFVREKIRTNATLAKAAGIVRH